MNHIPNPPEVIITCGPSYEPLDQVRRITNSSTGELGMMLGECFVKEGFSVMCLRGEGATYRKDIQGIHCQTFTTNENLISRIRALECKQSTIAFFHVAALCDFRVKSVCGENEQEISGGKISSRAGELLIRLEPAPKVISLLRSLFPSSFIVGWKYEVDGRSSTALERGRRQIQSNQTDGCVVNGPAFGSGFGFLEGENSEPIAFSNKQELCGYLVQRTKVFTKHLRDELDRKP